MAVGTGIRRLTSLASGRGRRHPLSTSSHRDAAPLGRLVTQTVVAALVQTGLLLLIEHRHLQMRVPLVQLHGSCEADDTGPDHDDVKA